ncbi:MAG TPA: stage III sporulation protein AC [Firmicutes bacterium]|nr:stage III sporulation protein AC [Bacillota bacterium]
MDVSLIFQIAGIALIISVINIVLTQAGRQEQAHILNIVGVVIVLLLIIPTINQFLTTVRSVFRM